MGTIYHEIARTNHSRELTVGEPVIDSTKLPDCHQPAKWVNNSGQGGDRQISPRVRREGVMVYKRPMRKPNLAPSS